VRALGVIVAAIIYLRKNCREHPMKVLCAVAAIALLSGPVAYAQMPNINLMPEVQSKTPEQIEAEKERDKAYQESLRKIPDAKGSSDPWGTVRSDTPQAPAKSAKAPAKPKIKTGSNAN
jgi:hypothetical protein